MAVSRSAPRPEVPGAQTVFPALYTLPATMNEGSCIIGRTAKSQLGMKTGGGIFDYIEEEIASRRAEPGPRPVAVSKALDS